MSMPNIPDVKPAIDINIDDSINLLLESIAFEELGLAHVINAEAERIQFVFGTLDQQKSGKAPTINELLQVNDSVDKILKDVIKEEMLLEFKLLDIIKLTETTSSTTSTTTSSSTHTTTSTQSTTTTTTKKDKGIEALSVSCSLPAYSGNGSNRADSTTVTLMFTLTGGTTVTETEIFNGIKATTNKDFNYTIGNCDIMVKVTVTAEGASNSINITGATAEVTSNAVN